MRRIKHFMMLGWMRAKQAVSNEDGMSVIEIILILVVTIGLVIIFKSQLTNLVQSIFSKIVSESSGI